MSWSRNGRQGSCAEGFSDTSPGCCPQMSTNWFSGWMYEFPMVISTNGPNSTLKGVLHTVWQLCSEFSALRHPDQRYMGVLAVVQLCGRKILRDSFRQRAGDDPVVAIIIQGENSYNTILASNARLRTCRIFYAHTLTHAAHVRTCERLQPKCCPWVISRCTPMIRVLHQGDSPATTLRSSDAETRVDRKVHQNLPVHERPLRSCRDYSLPTESKAGVSSSRFGPANVRYST